MLSVQELINDESKVTSPAEEGSKPLLSIIVLCNLPEHETRLRELIDRWTMPHPELEILIIVEPSFCPSSDGSFRGFASWCMERGCKLIMPEVPCGLPALRFDEGILESQGQWVWLMDLEKPVPTLDSSSALQLVRRASPDALLFLVHPSDEKSLPNIPGVKLPWLDVLFKGGRFPLENIFFPRGLFATRGLFDPHIVMKSFFLDEFLRRICRYVRFEKVDDESAVAGLGRERFPTIFTLWLDTDRRARLIYPRILDYFVDDLDQFENLIPRSILWDAYLQYVLPYYFNFRHRISEGFPERIQSLAPKRNHIQCIKGSGSRDGHSHRQTGQGSGD